MTNVYILVSTLVFWVLGIVWVNSCMLDLTIKIILILLAVFGTGIVYSIYF